jgi:hypothetical protein
VKGYTHRFIGSIKVTAPALPDSRDRTPRNRGKAMTSLTLKRARAFRPSGQWSDKDYDVLADGKVVGRIYEDATAALPTMRWCDRPLVRGDWEAALIQPPLRQIFFSPATSIAKADVLFLRVCRARSERRRAWASCPSTSGCT